MLLTTQSNGFDDGLDPTLDTIGVKLDKVVICGVCGSKVEARDKNTFFCSKCGKEYVVRE